jgi:excinuclease ABC subunit C
MKNSDWKEIQENIPHAPGIYQFKDEEHTVLYVGKAKDLRKRVASYFSNSKSKSHKVRVLLKNSVKVDYTVVHSEQDALLLENTLIKKLQPRYNIMLKDGKTYVYICIKNEPFPRVFFTRRVIKDGSKYFGPYTSKQKAQVLLNLIKKLFPLRTCKLNLTQENIEAGKFKICLEYHIKNCEGPCEALESKEQYDEKIRHITNILKGNFSEVKRHLRDKLIFYSETLQFERAQRTKDKLDIFTDFQAKSTVVNASIEDVDVFSIHADEETAYVNYLKVINGALINAFTEEFVINLDTDPKDILSYAVEKMRSKFNSIAPEIIVPFEIDSNDILKQTIPSRGDKRKLLDMSEKNVRYFYKQREKQKLLAKNKVRSEERILKTLQKDLNMKEIPMHIECFDNSNIMGSFPVASCVVFKNAKPSKNDYRKFNIKTVEGPNDFASMEEVVYRRYKRLVKEGEALPQLIIIDGGKGQLSSAMKSMDKLGLRDQIVVIGIAKRLEEIFFPGDPIPIYIDKKSESLKLIQQLRNEAHRFAITFHRNQRSKNFTNSQLLEVPGIGVKTAQTLLKKYHSVKKIRSLADQELAEVLNKKQIQNLRDFLNKA